MDKSWVRITPRCDPAYLEGCEKFLEFAYLGKEEGSKICCPCKKCLNRYYEIRSVVRGHIICNGFHPSYMQWTYHGELCGLVEPENDDYMVADDMVGMLHDAFGVPLENDFVSSNERSSGPDEETKKFFKILELAKRELYPGCKKFTTLAYVVRLLHLKVLYNLPNVCFDTMIQLIKEALPDDDNLPNSFYEAKKLKESLGFTYVKYDACPKNCMLYWKDKAGLDKCDFCGEDRYKTSNEVEAEDGTTKVGRIPRKQMRYFPLKPRLQRLFMCSKTSKSMRWHAEGRVNDGIVRHPADSLAWKSFDDKYPDFASDPRNVRLGLASDGFNPFRTITIPHSTWPVLLMQYNSEPWSCTRPSNIILSILIDGPEAPGNDIDVYLQPLIEDLNEFWKVGVPTFDASTNEMFQLRASLMWTINDFPAYANLSGWSTKGELACPPCNKETQFQWLKHGKKFSYGGHRRFLAEGHKFRKDANSFDGTVEIEGEPPLLSGEEVFKQVEHIEKKYGKRGVDGDAVTHRKKSRATVVAVKGVPVYNWKKRSIFFELPYWKDLLIRHNLDVMHIEKNVCESVVNTILDAGKKSKDNLNSRLDLKDMGLRESLHPQQSARGKPVIPPAQFTMSKRDKDTFCKVLKDVKVPDGYSSNISRRVHLKDRTLMGLKSHDCHILMQQLLPIALRRTLPKHVVQVLIELCSFFRHLCSKSLDTTSVLELQQKVTLTLCHIEKIFPPSFLDIMMHLPVHLAHEASIAGPVTYRWMYHVERYLLTLKKYVRNKSRPEGSIAEGYLIEECLTFCSRYLDDVETKLTRPSRNNSSEVGRALGAGRTVYLDPITREQAHRYVLANSESIDPYRDEHKALLKRENPQLLGWDLSKLHNKTFPKWLRDHVQSLGLTCKSDEVKTLSLGPSECACRYSGYIINGLKFHTKQREMRRKTQNSGVWVTASTDSYATRADRRPATGDVPYFGVLKDIIELRYTDGTSFVLFKCDWVDNRVGMKEDEFKFTLVNFKHLLYKNNTVSAEPFVLASQAQQVWYVKDPIDTDWHVAVKMIPRDSYDLRAEDNTTCAQSEPYCDQQIGDDSDVVREYVDVIEVESDSATADPGIDGDDENCYAFEDDFISDSDDDGDNDDEDDDDFDFLIND